MCTNVSHFSDLHGKLDFMWWLVVLWMVSQLFSHQAISDNTLKKYCYSASLVKLKFLGMCVCVLKGSIHFGWEFAWLLAVWIWLHTVIFLNNLLASFMDIVFCTIVHDASTLVFWVQHWWVFCSTLVGFLFNIGGFFVQHWWVFFSTWVFLLWNIFWNTFLSRPYEFCIVIACAKFYLCILVIMTFAWYLGYGNIRRLKLPVLSLELFSYDIYFVTFT